MTFEVSIGMYKDFRELENVIYNKVLSDAKKKSAGIISEKLSKEDIHWIAMDLLNGAVRKFVNSTGSICQKNLEYAQIANQDYREAWALKFFDNCKIARVEAALIGKTLPLYDRSEDEWDFE